MNEVKWIKIVTNIFDDEKILLIDNYPESDTILVIWFKLLCLAGKQNNGGVIMMNDRIAYTDEMLATVFRRNINTVRLALKLFEEYGMIEIIDGAICIPKWEKHQNIDGLERIREQTRKRVEKCRKKQKMLTEKEECNVTGNDTVTLSNAIEEDTEIERDIDIEKKSIYCPSDNGLKPSEKQIEEWFDECWEAYPKKQGRKKSFNAFKNSIKHGSTFEEILEGVKRYANYVWSNRIGYGYIKMGSTFFCGECWNDEYGSNINQTPDYTQVKSDVDDIDF